jgi:hypothetical protein
VESSGKAPGTKVAPLAAHAARSWGKEPRSSIEKLRAEILRASPPLHGNWLARHYNERTQQTKLTVAECAER